MSHPQDADRPERGEIRDVAHPFLGELLLNPPCTAGIASSRTSRVIAIEKTPSLNASTRLLSDGRRDGSSVMSRPMVPHRDRFKCPLVDSPERSRFLVQAHNALPAPSRDGATSARGGAAMTNAATAIATSRPGSTSERAMPPAPASSTRRSSAGTSGQPGSAVRRLRRARSTARTWPGIGGTMSPDQPTAWSVYIGTDDVDALAKKVTAAGGTVLAPAFDVGDQGRMAVFQDPPAPSSRPGRRTRMGGFKTPGPERVRLGRAQRSRRRQGPCRSTSEVFGWDAEDDRLARAAVHRVPGRRPERRRRDRDEPDGARRRCRTTGSSTSASTTSTPPTAKAIEAGGQRDARRRWTSRAAGCRWSAIRRAALRVDAPGRQVGQLASRATRASSTVPTPGIVFAPTDSTANRPVRAVPVDAGR